ncbi:SWIM zinc finger family protein [Chitinophaga eiseniae]
MYIAISVVTKIQRIVYRVWISKEIALFEYFCSCRGFPCKMQQIRYRCFD